jgi:hypothetical protein
VINQEDEKPQLINELIHHHGIATEPEPSSVQNLQELEQLQKWHPQNCAVLEKHSEQIRNWYQDLFTIAEKAAQKIPFNYKYSHLIRDTFFALNHELDTVKQYISICPNPLENCDGLLALKPNLPIYNYQPFDDEELTLLPVAFQALYAQHKSLKKNPQYSMESELLIQAMHSLLFVYRTKDQMHASEIPHINQDPRYEPLKRHRGFLKIWELIEDLCRLIIGKLTGQAEHEYSKRPCFFKTQSLRLLEKADHLIMEPAPAPNAVLAG